MKRGLVSIAVFSFLFLGTTVNSFSTTKPIILPNIVKYNNKIPRRRNSVMSSFSLFSKEDDDNSGIDTIASIPIPTVTQILSTWLVVIAGNRILESFHYDGGNIVVSPTNIAFNGIVLMGGLYTLIQTLLGVNYDSLEDFDTNSWARQAGIFALEGTVPSNFEMKNNDDVVQYEVATFAGGCFWGTELRFQRQVGVIATAVGYTQGNVDKPNYEQVCSGTTGHAEGIQLLYDPTICSYDRLANILFDSIPDPTLLNQVGNDRGTQYRHGIYYHSKEQQKIAQDIWNSRQAQNSNPITTELKPADVFWPAENYHQRYLEKGGQSAEKNCEEKIRCYG